MCITPLRNVKTQLMQRKRVYIRVVSLKRIVYSVNKTHIIETAKHIICFEMILIDSMYILITPSQNGEM